MSCEVPDRLSRTAQRLLEHSPSAACGKDWWNSRQKRNFEKTFSLGVSAVVVGPVVLSALAILHDEGINIREFGDAFYTRRVDYSNYPVYYDKLRTMSKGADAFEADIVARYGSVDAFKRNRSDTRITRIGGFLRRTSIDELPQFIGVARDRLALAGPRAMSDAEWKKTKVDLAEDQVFQRYSAALMDGLRFGMFGVAAVVARSGITPEQRIGLEAMYVDNASFKGDLKIIGMAFMSAVSGKGAY